MTNVDSLTRPDKIDPVDLERHAKNCGINPDFENPQPLLPITKNGSSSEDNVQTMLFQDDLNKRMSKMFAKCRTYQEETGLNVFFAIFGLLEWPGPRNCERKTASDTKLFTPILLAPLKLEKRKFGSGYQYKVSSEEEDLVPNFVLTEILRTDYDFVPPLFKANEQEKGSPIKEYLKELSQSILKSPINKFNLKVRNQILLGLFPYGGMAIYNDLNPARSWYSNNPLIIELLYGRVNKEEVIQTPQAGIDVDLEAIKEDLNLVMSADSSQVRTILDIMRGNNLTVEGPPGSGKSQTIVNTIAQALFKGKKILFVAEKLAALEVVKSRLEAVGLEEFLLPLQANRASKSEVIASIKKRMELKHTEKPDVDEKALKRRYSDLKTKLDDYSMVMGQKFGKTEFTIYDIFGRAIATAAKIKIPVKAKTHIWNLEEMNDLIIDDIKKAGDYYQKSFIESKSGYDFWSGHKVKDLDNFLAEQILHFTEELALSLDEWLKNERNLIKIGVNNLSNTYLQQIIHILNNFLINLDDLDKNILLYIYDNKLKQDIEFFLLRCHEYLSTNKILSTYVSNIDDEKIVKNINTILNITNKYNLELFDTKELSTQISQMVDQKKLLENFLKILELLAKTRPELAFADLADLTEAARLAAQCGRPALDFRDHKFPPSYDRLLTMESFLVAAKKLNDEKDRLKTIFTCLDFEDENSFKKDEETLDCAKTLENPGFFPYPQSIKKINERLKHISEQISAFSPLIQLFPALNSIKLSELAKAWRQAALCGERVLNLRSALPPTREVLDELSRALTDAQGLIERKESLASFFTKADFDDLGGPEKDEEIINQALILENNYYYEYLEEKNQLEDRLKQISEQQTLLAPLVNSFPRLASVKLSQLAEAGQIASQCGRQALNLRNQLLADQVDLDYLDKIISTAQELTAKKLSLTSVFPDLDFEAERTAELNKETLRHATIFENSGFFSFLSPTYQKSKTFWRSVSHQPLKPKTSAAHLHELVSWRLAQRDFNEDPRAKNILGSHFKGLKTDFEPFARLRDYYRHVFDKFPGLSLSTFRNFLLETNSDTLLSMPRQLEEEPEGTYDTLIQTLEKLNETLKDLLEKINRTIKFWNSLTANPLNAKKSAQRLRELVQWRRTKRIFEADPGFLKIIGPHFKSLDTDFESLKRLMEFYKLASTLYPPQTYPALHQTLVEAQTKTLINPPPPIYETLSGNYRDLIQSQEDLSSSLETIKKKVEQTNNFWSSLTTRPLEQISSSLALWRLILWQRAKLSFDLNAEKSKIFDPNFFSLKTDFESYSKLIIFYRNVFKQFPFESQKAARDMLFEVEADVLESIDPQINLEGLKTFKELSDKI
jgi:hypothetical protein